MRRRPSLSVAGIVAVVGILALVGTASSSPAGPYGGILRVVDEPPGEPFGVPWEITAFGTIPAIPSLEPLIWMDRDGTPRPLLARRWELSPDRRQLTLLLRQGVRFHDGSAFDARAVRFALENQKKAGRFPDLVRVEVLEPDRVRLVYRRWDNRILVGLAGTFAMVVSPQAISRMGLERARWHPVGTGPFQFVRYERDSYVRYRKFPQYWDRGKPYLDELELRFIRDLQTLKAALLARQVDVAGIQDPRVIRELQAAGFRLVGAPNYIVMLVPDSANANSPLAKREVREAVSYAIDRQAIVQALGPGVLQVTNQIAFPEHSAYLRDLPPTPYNPNRAKELLAQAGYPNGFQTRLIAPPFVERDAVVAIQRYLSKIGIQADPEFPEIGRYREYQTKGWTGFLVQLYGFFANYNSMIGFYYIEAPEGYVSLRRPPQLQSLFQQSIATLQPEPTRTQAVHRLLLEDRTVIPLWMGPRVYVAAPHVHNTHHMRGVAWPFWKPAEAWVERR
ncbi:MAG: ABC transporter substrate-binding protein [Armatimonadetes bacterium]|nr:ABC transporter substrate-binding protein [Armatimonadota bacterium]MDW8154833.1 ABC transporter substrate-binding protein [Armatimonadota bacterium]